MDLFKINFVSKSPSTGCIDEETRIFPAKWTSNFYNPLQKQQNFSVPSRLIYYILKNPSSPNIYQKLIQTCKYFFIKNQILPLSSMHLGNPDRKWYTSFNENIVSDYINIPCKFWLTQKFSIHNIAKASDIDLNFNKYAIGKIFQSDIKILHLFNQNICYDSFVFLVPKCEEIWFDNVLVKDYDGTIVPLEKLLESLSQLKQFHFRNLNQNLITSKTVEEMLKIPHLSKFEKFYLADIPEIFDIRSFFIYLKKNMKTKWYLKFCDEISEQYKDYLSEIVEEIIHTENHIYEVPFIFFHGMNDPTLEKLENLSMKNVSKSNIFPIFVW